MWRLFVIVMLVIVPVTSSAHSHAYYMRKAIQLAKQNPRAPFAAIVVNAKGKIICQGVNDSKHNPTLHGEIVAINDCVAKHPDVNWRQAILYTTAEPCPMCASAIIWARIGLVVFGTSIDYLLKQGWGQITIPAKQVMRQATFYHGKIIGGVLAKQTDQLFLR